MQHTVHPRFAPCLWSTTGAWQWLRVGLLALMLSSCAAGPQGPSRQTDPGLADAKRAWTTAHTPAEELRALEQLGDAYRKHGQPTEAIAAYKHALTIIRNVYNRRGEELLLNRLGLAYYDLSQYTDALSYYEQALAGARQAHNRPLEGSVLNNLGNVYRVLGQLAKALAFYEQALAIRREVKDRAGEGATLNNLGLAYGALSQYERAIAFYEQALAIRREVKDRAGEGATLNNLGIAYGALSQYEQAIAFYEQALAIRREVKDRAGEGVTLTNLGNAYRALSQYERAIAFHEQALAIAREVKDRAGEGRALNNLGFVYGELGQNERAIVLSEQALTIRREVKDRAGEGRTLDNLATAYQALSQYERAIALHEQTLAIRREVKDRAGEGVTLTNLMQVWKARTQPRLAIFYGKLAVNVYQEIRTDIQRLDQELQQRFLTSKETVYRTLAELLITEGRLPEAQQVLDLLKVEEYLDFVRRDATAATALHGQATLTPEEAKWAERYAAIADQVATLGAERGTLRARPTRTAAEDARLAHLEADLTAANWAFQRFLADLQTELGRTPLAQEKLFHLRETQGLSADLRDLGPGTVALYTLVSDTATRVLLITPDVQLAREVPVAAADLSRKVWAFRNALEAVQHRALPPDPRPLAHELYTLLVAPVAADLQAVQAQTLLWSLDGVLRYVPLAALYDGERYLVERYALVVFTPASQARLKDAPQPRWQALGLGVSKAHAPFPALPGVVSELRGIIRDPAQGATEGVLPGTIQLDEAFTTPALLAALRQRYPVVHIASHFWLQPGDETASFLLLGDGSRLSLAQVKTWPTVFGGVDLLALSACHTATGGTEADGKEVEGFSVLAQRQGAKAVVATLWPVEDASTKELMQTFYRLRVAQPGLSKVEALRQAQVRLLTGAGPHVVPSSTPERGLQTVPEHTRESLPPPTRFVRSPQAPYAHPYYWSPFVLMGNWQ